jgi:hypothetical protein
MGIPAKIEREKIMIERHYHKGQICVYGPVFCQEGYCGQCEIYLCFTENGELAKSRRSLRPKFKTKH